jgi:transposase-like protein
MAERGLGVDHHEWSLRAALPPELTNAFGATRPPNRSWRVDETYVRVAG